jgi:putative alpha-1,2-mannosidase
MNRDDAGVVIVRIATSLISAPQALLNFHRELPESKGFDTIEAEARAVWHK